MAEITGSGQRWMAERCESMRFMKPPIWSSASGADRSMDPREVRSAPTLKYFSYADARTTPRTAGSSPSSPTAPASSSMRSSAIALLPLRCMTTRAIAPLRSTSTFSPTGSGREERDAAGDLDHRAGDVARLLGAEKRDGVGDVLGLAEALEHSPLLEALVHRVVGRGGLARLRLDDARRDGVGRDV